MAVDLNDFSTIALKNESDVEQKLIIPLLTASEWLDVPAEAIHTKNYLPPANIGKGRKREIGYYPDYSIWFYGFPIAIVEAKSPNEDTEEGFREAQLYAHEINKAYPSGVSPVQIVACINGREIRIGSWDSNDSIVFMVTDLKLGSSFRRSIVEEFGWQRLRQLAENVKSKFRPTMVFRGVDYIGADAVLNRTLEYNSFAVEIAPLVRMFFAPEAEDRIDEIIRKGYVSSIETTKYDQMLEVFLRDSITQIKNPSVKGIQTTVAGESLLTPEIRKFQQTLPTTGHIQLIIGSVGAGKSLFCKRYRLYLQPGDIAEAAYWTTVDFNQAPDDLSNAERWLCEEFIKSFEQNHPDFDLYNINNLERIFAPDVNRIKKIYTRVSAVSAGQMEEKIAELVHRESQEPIKFAREICRYINGDRRQAIVVVFDNVDRLDRNAQVKIFQIAQWFKAETRSFCLLPLRDETYEQYKNKPPLDAFLNAIHFRIEPPRFIDVVRKRLELCLDHIARSAQKTLSYQLPDGKRIVYPADRLGEFLKTLYADIFQDSRRVSWLLEALAGKNVRRSLEMFIKIVMSGHLDERQITGTVLGTRKFQIRDATIVNVLMKTDYVYFADGRSFVSNVLYCDQKWRKHSNFLVFEALDFLVVNRKERSVIGSQGYFSVIEVINKLNRMGFDPDDARSAIEFLVGANLVTTDHFGKMKVEDTDYVRATAAGFVHSRLLIENIHYISGIIPVTFILDRNAAERMGRLLSIRPGFSDVQFSRKVEAASALRDYLYEEYQRHSDEAALFANLANSSRYLLRSIDATISGVSPGI